MWTMYDNRHPIVDILTNIFSYLEKLILTNTSSNLEKYNLQVRWIQDGAIQLLYYEGD